MLTAAIMNTLKHTIPKGGDDPWLKMSPVGVICQFAPGHQRLSITVANRFRRDSVRLWWSQEGGTRMVLKIFQDRLRAVGAQVSCSLEAAYPSWPDEVIRHLKVGPQHQIVATDIVFKGDCVKLFM